LKTTCRGFPTGFPRGRLPRARRPVNRGLRSSVDKLAHQIGSRWGSHGYIFVDVIPAVEVQTIGRRHGYVTENSCHIMPRLSISFADTYSFRLERYRCLVRCLGSLARLSPWLGSFGVQDNSMRRFDRATMPWERSFRALRHAFRGSRTNLIGEPPSPVRLDNSVSIGASPTAPCTESRIALVPLARLVLSRACRRCFSGICAHSTRSGRHPHI